MKRLYLVGAIAAMAAGLALAGSQSAYAASQKGTGISAKLPTGTVSIVFDGYCDGMTLTNPGSGGAPGVEAERTGSCTSPDFLYGGDLGNRAGMADSFYGLYVVIDANHHWAYYADCGFGNTCLVVSGTWSLGVPSSPDKPASTARVAGLFAGQQAGFAGAQRLPGPNAASFDINFVGYCDGEHLTNPGSSGYPSIDGYQIGCVGNPLLGARSNSAVGMWSYTDNYYYQSMMDGSWIIFTDCGGTECYVNSGTWAFGAPAVPQQNRTAVPSNLQH